MITTVIVDHHQESILSLAGLLTLYCPSVKVAGFANSVKKGIDVIRDIDPCLVFLDVQIGKETGFDLLDQLEDFKGKHIFITSHQGFALKAYHYESIDYVLKPFGAKSIKRALEKYQAHKPSSIISQPNRKILSFHKRYFSNRITISSADGFSFIEVPQIIRIAGQGNYSTFHLLSGEQVVSSKNLKCYESLLPNDHFIKVHQSHIVNLQYIRKLTFKNGSQLELKDGSQIPLARRRREHLMSALNLA